MITEQVTKQAMDVAAYGTVVGAIAGWLPSVAALFSILWLSVQIWESKTANKLKAKLNWRK